MHSNNPDDIDIDSPRRTRPPRDASAGQYSVSTINVRPCNVRRTF